MENMVASFLSIGCDFGLMQGQQMVIDIWLTLHPIGILSSDLCPNGRKRPGTNEVRDFRGSASSPSSPPSLSMSFKDKVSADFGKAEDNMVIGDEDYIIQQREVPSIQFSDKIKKCLFRPWKSAIIIKLMGRSFTFNFLRERLLRRWQLKGPMTLIDLENNFFIVKFLLEEDMK
ncbi:hypothetical protein DKX38_008042 [Salix brachista]|uniref:DUF4283 domain-containing protein n=1 Tax=Salix brachista TaxID=2182728 RepID=A0A5N5MRS0_9ROSI|nr:hypothetical protein DKX38_008042 [Salix brachista]